MRGEEVVSVDEMLDEMGWGGRDKEALAYESRGMGGQVVGGEEDVSGDGVGLGSESEPARLPLPLPPVEEREEEDGGLSAEEGEGPNEVIRA